MNPNTININTRALITQAIQDVALQSSRLPITDPMQPVLDNTLNELATLNSQVVREDITHMADTIGQHLGALQTLTTQITATTEDLTRLSATLKKVADAIGFLVTIHTQASGLGLLELLTPPTTASPS